MNPKSSKSTGGDIITITGAGFDTSAVYHCRFFSDLQTLLFSPPTQPLDTNTIKCVTPNWAAKFNTEIQQIGFEVYHTIATGEINVPRPPGPAFFFSFSLGSAAWTAVTVILVGSIVSAVAVLFARPLFFWIGIVIVAAGGIAGLVLRSAGFGQQSTSRHSGGK